MCVCVCVCVSLKKNVFLMEKYKNGKDTLLDITNTFRNIFVNVDVSADNSEPKHPKNKNIFNIWRYMIKLFIIIMIIIIYFIIIRFETFRRI